MENRIVILSPGPGCRKTQRIITSIKNVLERNSVKYVLTIEYELAAFISYKTWILPTVIINDQVVSRGYNPPEQTLLKFLKRT